MTEAWAWPQWTYAGLFAVSVVMAVANDGKPKTGKHSGLATLLGTGIGIWLLYCGGFWK